MHLELILLDEICIGEEESDLVPLVSLQLDDLAVLGMLHDRAVAGELLLAHPHDLLQVVLVGQPLHGGEGLPAVPLLDPDVDDGVLNAVSVALVSVQERIESLEVLNC